MFCVKLLNSRICELHLEERFLIRNSKRLKLCPAAYPTVFPDIRGPEPEPEKDHLYGKMTPSLHTVQYKEGGSFKEEAGYY